MTKLQAGSYPLQFGIHEKLLKAKENVKWLLINPDGLVDMHGIEYWAGVVERLRQEVKI